jgi:hypothetical protein
MEVKVIDSLAAIGVGVDHDAVASLSDPRLASQPSPE